MIRLASQNPDIIIVGAGAAGVGMAATLKDFGIENFKLIDRHEVGASFNRWPAETRLITPSFNTTPFGILDLNSVTLNTSVANYLGEEHPTGKRYAMYLRAVLKAMEIPVETGWEVTDVEDRPEGGFTLTGPQGSLTSKFLIWAAGEFQFPQTTQFPGAELCLHNSHIPAFSELDGRDFLIIGAFESGVDAAVHLAERGKNVILLCREKELALADQDPSRSLSPFTRQRLHSVLSKRDNLKIAFESNVVEVKPSKQGFEVLLDNGTRLHAPTAPILATGFRGGTRPVEHLFDFREDGDILLSENDESTYVPGLFLAGPLVRHDHHIFCYIYKFRQRFAIIAEAIAQQLGTPVPYEIVETYERNQMRLSDLSCCGEECAC